jgi:hypothetical protein
MFPIHQENYIKISKVFLSRIAVPHFAGRSVVYEVGDSQKKPINKSQTINLILYFIIVKHEYIRKLDLWLRRPGMNSFVKWFVPFNDIAYFGLDTAYPFG